VARHLFEGLRDSGQCQISCIATSHLAGAYDYLRSRGISADEVLKSTPLGLALSGAARSLTEMVHRSMGDRSIPARARRRLLAKIVAWCERGESSFSPAWLEEAQIYHSPHTPFPPVVQASTRIRKFLTCHDFIPLKNPELFSQNAQRFMRAVLGCLQPDNFAFCVSETTRNDVLTYSKMSPERVFVTPLAADPAVFHPVTDVGQLAAIRERYGLGEAPYFLALSAHDPHKNFGHIIECFGEAVEAGDLSDCNLVIVGPNPGRNPAAVKAIERFPRSRGKFRILGFVPDEDLAGLYSGAVAFLFPSLAEGFGIPPLEAMQCGVPVIASNTTSIPEVVGDAGLLLPPTDTDLWSAAMLKLKTDPELCREFARRSRTRAQLFSWPRFIEETLAGYRTSLQS